MLFRYLLTESRSRRVIVVENPFLPDPIKRIIGEVLLDNLQVSLRKVNISPIYPRSPFPSNLSLFSFLDSSLFGFSKILTVELTNMSISALRRYPDPQVRSVSFTPAPILALMAVGKTTGLVLDVGYRESTVVPVSPGWFLFRELMALSVLQSLKKADELCFPAVIYHLVLC
jgi:hypothetical protein